MPEPKGEREENISFSDFSAPPRKSKSVTTTVMEFGEDAVTFQKSPPEKQAPKVPNANTKLQTLKKQQSEKRQSLSPVYSEETDRIFDKLSWDLAEVGYTKASFCRTSCFLSMSVKE